MNEDLGVLVCTGWGREEDDGVDSRQDDVKECIDDDDDDETAEGLSELFGLDLKVPGSRITFW